MNDICRARRVSYLSVKGMYTTLSRVCPQSIQDGGLHVFISNSRGNDRKFMSMDSKLQLSEHNLIGAPLRFLAPFSLARSLLFCNLIWLPNSQFLNSSSVTCPCVTCLTPPTIQINSALVSCFDVVSEERQCQRGGSNVC